MSDEAKAYTTAQVRELHDRITGGAMLVTMPDWYKALSPEQQEQALGDATGIYGIDNHGMLDDGATGIQRGVWLHRPRQNG